MRTEPFIKPRSTGAIRIHSIVLMVFAVGMLWFLLTILRGGEHPLAIRSDLVLCEEINQSTWQLLPSAFDGAIARAPSTGIGASNFCALELDPVSSGDRFERIARGDDADRVRVIATVMIMTRASIFRQTPSLNPAKHMESWSAEMTASGWTGKMLEGPWKRGELFNNSRGQQGILPDDDGIMFWITADDVESDRLVTFSKALVEDLKTAKS